MKANLSAVPVASTVVGAGGVGVGGGAGGVPVHLDAAAGVAGGVAAGRSAAQALIERELKDRDLKEAQRRLNALEVQADELYAKGEYAAALEVYVNITGTGGAVLQWSDQEKFVSLRSRQVRTVCIGCCLVGSVCWYPRCRSADVVTLCSL